MAAKIEVGTQISPISKKMTQEFIDKFEACGRKGGGAARVAIDPHSSPEVASRIYNLATPIASGHMQLSFVTEALRRFFGPEIFNHTGMVSLRYPKPLVDGSTATVKGKVIEITTEKTGRRVTVEVWIEDQRGDKTAIGKGAAIVP